MRFAVVIHSCWISSLSWHQPSERKVSCREDLYPYCRKLYCSEKSIIILSLHPGTSVDILVPWTRTIMEVEDKNWDPALDSVHPRHILKYQWRAGWLILFIDVLHGSTSLLISFWMTDSLNVPLLKLRWKRWKDMWEMVKKVCKRWGDISLANGEDRSHFRFLDESL